MKTIDSSLYIPAVREYLEMPKDIGFECMESLVDAIMELESITWTEAYEFFGSLVDRVIMEKY